MKRAQYAEYAEKFYDSTTKKTSKSISRWPKA
jgi:hypothetical protein